MTKGVVDWNDIRQSVQSSLGPQRQGWVDQLTMLLEEIKLEIDAKNTDVEELTRYPQIAQIKQKFGELCVYQESASEPFGDHLQHQVGFISQTCECCGNAAKKQQIQFYVTTLCCWCYNAELKSRNEESAASWPADLEMDVAESFPDFVSPSCASLKPATGSGWYVMLGRYLQQMELQLRNCDVEHGSVQISDVKTTRDGRISIGWHRYHESLDHFEERLVFESTITCAKCGHIGDIVRGPNRSEPFCAHCMKRHRDD